MNRFPDNPWFLSLPQVQADALLAAAQPMRLAAGQVLYRQGDLIGPATAAFFGVTRGNLKLSILHSDGKEGILAVIEPGNWFGEVALLDTTLRRAHTAIVLDDCELAAVNAGSFDILMREAAFAHAIARLVAGRLRLAYEALAGQALQSTRERVARRLVMLAHGDLTQAASGRPHITSSQDNLAMMLGVSRPTLNKELQSLAREGALSLRYGRIEILDMERLRAAGSPASPEPMPGA
ncbi:Crp/Fnr family transcriptional regulator [Variovorax sp. OV329]|uniref:Crp/Fnr family transcriptional regulator n=1 Tax=Variovorax sp. OV329 TaxID=1882825 RepID=UPI0008DFFEE0|nr:Crp/Fnr family transcriptional regulator [Variovorax sp. OV329]SFN19327.1 cAMP-binding domain of CRP or a regulatory subunit of cAMP-dependent protein kinases [Variovorax sp. OV329]